VGIEGLKQFFVALILLLRTQEIKKALRNSTFMATYDKH